VSAPLSGAAASGRAPRHVVGVALVVVLISALWAAAAPTASQAKAPLTTGFADPYYLSPDDQLRDFVLEKTAATGSSIVRMNLLWRTVAPNQPLNARNPADPGYDFSAYDGPIRDAVAHGLQPLITIYRAPIWAEGAGRPAGTPGGSWKPRPAAIADFAHALATRYSGSFATAEGTLPRVRLYQFWNEPNLTTYLNPQYENGVAASPAIYRDMLNAFYGEIKAVNPDNVVITAGTAPYGDPPNQGAGRFRPLAFWRDVLCVGQGKKKPKPIACPVKPAFDVLAHHPINTSGGPDHSAVDPDDISTPDLGNLRDVLRAAERGNNTATAGPHQIWATEIWWETNPPDGFEGIAVKRQARWLEQSLYLLWKQGARVVINLQVRDAPYDKQNPFGDDQTGVFFVDGSPKLSATAWRFPFVSAKKPSTKGKRLIVWGRAPVDGRLKIQRLSAGKWKQVASTKAHAGEVFQKTLKLPKNSKLRARVGGEQSLIWGGA